MDKLAHHPRKVWKEAAWQSEAPSKYRLRLAAMAGHIQLDKIAARRAALIDLLADGRPYQREAIWEAVSEKLGEACWGKVPQEALARDLSALRKGGIRIAYSRHPKTEGYYLQHPPLERPSSSPYESINWTLIHAISQLTVPEKNARAFAAAEFALRQKEQILAQDHLDWAPEAVSVEARRLVFGVAKEAVDSSLSV